MTGPEVKPRNPQIARRRHESEGSVKDCTQRLDSSAEHRNIAARRLGAFAGSSVVLDCVGRRLKVELRRYFDNPSRQNDNYFEFDAVRSRGDVSRKGVQG